MALLPRLRPPHNEPPGFDFHPQAGVDHLIDAKHQIRAQEQAAEWYAAAEAEAAEAEKRTGAILAEANPLFYGWAGGRKGKTRRRKVKGKTRRRKGKGKTRRRLYKRKGTKKSRKS